MPNKQPRRPNYSRGRDDLVEPDVCARCQATVLAGQVDGARVMLDLVPLDSRAEAFVVMRGIDTYQVRKFGLSLMAIRRYRLHFLVELRHATRAGLVLGEHTHRGERA